MPAVRLSTANVSVDQYDVLASGDETTGLMTHTMLYAGVKRNDVTGQTDLDIAHMGPPLESQSRRAHAAGTASLTDEQKASIKTFVDRSVSSSKAEQLRDRKLGLRQYVIHRSIEPPSKQSSLWRYSCVGFVLHAYSTARIRLLEKPAPLKTLAQTRVLYPDYARNLGKQATQRRLGVEAGTGTVTTEGEAWPIELAGYVLHSLHRPVEQINGPNAVPYSPRVGDEYYPRRNSTHGKALSTKDGGKSDASGKSNKG